jgi:amino acid adenylation domain-containing protein
MIQTKGDVMHSHRRCIHWSFERQAAEHPDAIAVVAGASTVTFDALNAQANRLARHLRALGVGPDTRVAIFADRSPDMIAGILAVLKAGGCYVPLDPTYPTERLRFMLDDSAPRIVLTCGRGPDADFPLAGRPLRVDLVADAESWHSQPGTNLGGAEVGGKHLAYVIYTSGSTGRPKAVGVEHDGLCNLVEAEVDQLRVGLASRVLQVASFNFDASVFEIFMVLCSGASLYLAPCGALLVGEALAAAVEAHAITHLTLTPTVLETLPEGSALLSLKTLVVAGEALPAAAVRRWANGRRLFNAYGPTEATVCATWYECRGTAERDPPIGKPLPNITVRALDGAGQALGVGEAGELYIGGRGVARGYLGRPDLTAERFVPDPFAGTPGARMFRTGDLGRLLADGNIEFLGRNDNQIKIRGLRIELGEVEAELTAHPAVQQARVVVRDGGAGDKELAAYYVARCNGVVDARALQKHLSRTLPEYMVPAAYVALDRLPFTPSGKLDVAALPSPEDVAHAGARYEPPVGELEQSIAGFWAEVLGVQRVGRDDDFFKLGGNSLRATMVISRIRVALSRDVSIQQLFAHPVLSAFAAALSDTKAIAERPRLAADARQEPALSAAEKRLWFVSQLEGARQAYHVAIGPVSWRKPSGLRLKGVLDRIALRGALDRLVQRHEALRATFGNAHGAPVLRIGEAPTSFTLQDYDLRDRRDSASELERLKRDERDRPFDLEHGPLIRGRLMQLADDEHVLLLTAHHIVCDGWSAELLLEELGALYAAFRAGARDPLPFLRRRYADSAAWQTPEELHAQTEYWKRALEGAPVSLNLPTDRPRPPQQSCAGDVVDIDIDAALTAGLKDLSARHGTTVYATLLAGWAGVLARLSNQEDVVIGTPFAGRTRSEVEKLVGCFINTVALRVDLSGEPTIAEVLARVRKRTIDAQRYQDVPFDRVVETINPARDPSRSPLFQVMFSWQNHAFGRLDLPGLRVTAEDALGASAKFDLELRLGEADGRIAGVLEFATSLFDRATIERHLACFLAMLRAMVQDDRQPVSKVDVLDAAERQQSADEWRAVDANVAASEPRCVHTLFEEQVARTPQAVAVVYGDRQITYASLNALANRVASELRGLGTGPDARVAICVERSIEMIASLLGTLKAGGAYVPLDPAYPTGRLAHMVRDSHARILLVDERTPCALRDQLHGASPHSLVTINVSSIAGQSDASSIADVPPAEIGLTPQHLAYVLFTSGSTGVPKGTGLSHEALCGITRWQVGRGEPHTTLQFAPLSFDVSFQEIFSTLCGGGALVLIDNPARQDPHRLFQIIRANRVQRLFLPYVALRMLAQALGDDPALECSLREIITAGEQLRITPAISRLFAKLEPCRLFNHYGPTESHVVTSFGLPSDSAGWPELPPIGRPLPHARLYVLDERGQSVPLGVTGELYIGGPAVARGYLDQPVLTAERFVPDPFATRPGARMYRTGDLARRRTDGELEFLGRNDFQVKIRGFRVELGEIEGRLAAHPAVRATVVDARGDGAGNMRLIAYYVAKHPVPTDELKAWLALALPEYMRPATCVELDELPLTPSGKVNRRALPEPPPRAPEADAPVGKVEKRIGAIWAEILGVEHVDRNENFFELGGHSLLGTVLVIRIRSEFGVELVLEDLFKAPALTEFARLVVIKQLERLQAARM